MVKWIGFLWGNLQVRMGKSSGPNGWGILRSSKTRHASDCVVTVASPRNEIRNRMRLQKVFSQRLKLPELLLGLPSYPEQLLGALCPLVKLNARFELSNSCEQIDGTWWNPINSSFPRFSNNSYDGTFFSMGNWVFCESWGIGETMINYYDMILLMVRSKSGTTRSWYVFPLFIGF